MPAQYTEFGALVAPPLNCNFQVWIWHMCLSDTALLMDSDSHYTPCQCSLLSSYDYYPHICYFPGNETLCFPKTKLQHKNLTFVSYDFPGTPLIFVDLTNRSENFKVKKSKTQLTSCIKETFSYLLNSLKINGLVATINGGLQGLQDWQ